MATKISKIDQEQQSELDTLETKFKLIDERLTKIEGFLRTNSADLLK